MPDLKLYHFLGSHFNEKVRWALEWKSIDYESRPLLPGLHIPIIRKLSSNTEVPVLKIKGKVIQGSSRIIHALEQRYAAPALYPDDETLRLQALQIQREFDQTLGPAIRLAVFYEVGDWSHARATFGKGFSTLKINTWKLLFPLMSYSIRHRYNVNTEEAQRARYLVSKALNFIAERTKHSDYLVGNQFSIADLTCASLLMLATDVSQWGGPTSSGTEKHTAWLQSWENHSSIDWVKEMYMRHRLSNPSNQIKSSQHSDQNCHQSINLYGEI